VRSKSEKRKANIEQSTFNVERRTGKWKITDCGGEKNANIERGKAKSEH
jgi:hypothetical protein